MSKMRILLLALLSCILVLASSNVFAANSKVKFLSPTTYATKSMDNAKISSAVEKAFGLNSANTKYKEAKVKIISTGSNYGQEYLIVYLLNNKSYAFDTVKIDLNKDYTIKAINKSYKEQEQDYKQYERSSGNYAGKSSDNDIDAVFATPVEDIDTAVAGINQAASLAHVASYNVKVLTGDEATVAAYQYWLKKTNVKVFGSIGHGSTTGIMLKDGVLSDRNFTLMPGALQNKVLYFNSCQTFNDPLKGSIINGSL